MPRDASGNYTLPAGNPVVTGTIIESDWANTTLNDVADEMTDSLSRTGEGGMVAPLGLPFGTNNVASLFFGTGVNNGLYAVNNVSFTATANGRAVQTWENTKVQIWDNYFTTFVEQGLRFDFNDVTLAGASGSIFIGSLDPSNNKHIAIDDENVQCKNNGTTATTLRLNGLGGNVIIGPSLTGTSGNVIIGGFSDDGRVDLYNDTSLVARTIDSSAGGLQVSNFLTGAGLERVLTESDLSTPQFDLVIDGGNPSLINANCALTTGTDDPSTFSHLAYGVNLIQAKMNGTTADTLFLNNLGGDVRIGSSSFASTFFVSGYSTTILQTVSPASGGVFVNNADTGTGLERVLTTSDLNTAPVVVGATPARFSYVIDQPTIAYDYIVSGDAPSTTFTIGATGSGADKIFTPFDVVPASATSITIRIIGDLDVQASANSNFTLTANHASDNAGIITGGNYNTFQVLGRSNADSNGRVGSTVEVKIPWVNNRIKTRYTIAGTITVSDLRFFLVGFDAN